MDFGMTVMPDPPYQRFIDLVKHAEDLGFDYGWTYDSHVLWQESIPTLALAAKATSTIKLGHMVTNPGHASRRCSRAHTRRCRTSPTGGWSWASGAAIRRGATSGSTRCR